MRLHFDLLELLNFKSFNGKHELDLAARGTGLHFLRGRNKDEPRLGSNGSGKTTLLADSITWCLYGRTPDGLKNPDIKPWKGKGVTEVKLHLRTDKEHHSITRSASPNKLLLDGRPVGQEQIDNLIGMSVDAFSNTVILGQGQELFFDLKPASKLDLFSAVLNLERWDKYSKEASDWAKEIEEQSEKLDRELIGLEAQDDELVNQISATKTRLKEWEDGRADKLTGFEKDLKALEKKLNTEQCIHGEADLAFDGAMTEIKYLEKQLRKFDTDLAYHQRVWDKACVEAAANRKRQMELEAELDELDNRKKCPTCGQKVTQDHFHERRKELASQIRALLKANILAPKRDLEKNIAYAKRAQTDCVKHLQEFRDKAVKAEQTLGVHGPIVITMQARICELKSSRESWEQENNPHRSLLQELRKRRTKQASLMDEMDETLRLAKEKHSRVQFWVKGFKDVRLYILHEVLQELEMTTNTMLEDVGLIDWAVQYDIEKETKSGTITRGITVRILSPSNKDAVRWECWSGGEGQRLRIIGALALSEVLLNNAGVNPDLEVLDEPTQHLSPEGVGDLCDYLSDRAHSLGKCLVYIDHQSIESARFDSVLAVVKTTKGSEIVI